MEDHPKNTLKRALLLGVVGIIVIVTLVWAVPSIVESMLKPLTRTFEPTDLAHSEDEVDTIVRDWIRRLGAAEVFSREEEDGVIRSIYRLPRGGEPTEVARRLRNFAEEEDLEVYTSLVDGIDIELRAYHGPRLRQQLLLVPDLPEPPSFAYGKQHLKRPMLSLIVTGLGNAADQAAINAKVPITVAIQPFTPFSLRNARLAAIQGHEVLVDLPSGMAIADGQSAIPYASGVWVNSTPVRALNPADVVVVPADMIGDASQLVQQRGRPQSRILAAQHSDRRNAIETLNRARHIAVRKGVSAMMIDIGDPGFGPVLAWAESADSHGYRMVLATEAVRRSEVQGPISDTSSGPKLRR
jgi:hypothetical protein